MFDNITDNRLSYENKQLKLQLETTMDQAKKFQDLASGYRKAYDELSKKVTSFCSCITSLEYAKRQIGGKNKMNNMSIDDLLAFTIDEYNKQKKEFQDIALKLTAKIDEKEKIVQDLTTQISIYEVERATPPHITNDIEGGVAYEPEMPDIPDLGLPDIDMPMPTPSIENEDGTVSLSIADDADFQPVSKTIQPEDLPELPMPDISEIENTPKQQKTKPQNKPAVVASKKQKAFTGPLIEEDELENDLNIDSASRIQVARQDVDAIPSMNIPDFDAPNPENVITEEKRQLLKQKLQQDNEQKMHMIDINPLIQDVMSNEISMSVFRLIGERGYSQMPQIKEMLESSSIEKGGKSSINIQINNMIRSKILERSNINTGYRRFIAIDFTAIGVRIFEEIFKKSPVETEMRRLKRENASLEHGYLIQDTMTILQKEFGYIKLIIDRKANSIKVGPNKTYIPDIVATIDGKTWDYIEVERGTHTQPDFNDKLDKMVTVTRTFHFVAQNQEILDNVIEKTNKWIELHGRQNLKGLTIKYSTVSHLSKRNWCKIESL